jgi:hypothetical protein
MAKEEATKSKLIKLLQRVSHGVVPRIGLVPAPEEKVPALALIAGFEEASAQALAAAVGAGADALAVGANGLGRWDELVKAAGDKPLGLWLNDSGASAEELKQYMEREPDFLIATAAGAPATLLSATGIGKVIALDESYPAQLVRALGEMPIDAVLVEAAANGAGGSLRVRDLLHYRQAVDLVRRPVLVAIEGAAFIDVLPALRDMGVEGLLLRVPPAMEPAALREQVERYRKAIAALGRPIGRGREMEKAPLVPRVTPGAPAAHEEPEEEPDDE